MRSVVWRQKHYGRLLSIYCASRTPSLGQPRQLAYSNHAFLHTTQLRTSKLASDRRETDPSFLTSDLDSGLTRPESTWEAVLERANVHGIESLEQLDHEADLGPERAKGKRIIDDDHARRDLDLWSVLLDYSNLKDGNAGVRMILTYMLYCGTQVELHADGLSEYIWRTVLPVILDDERLLYELCRSATPFICSKPMVFIDVVGELLRRGNLRLAIVCGTQIVPAHFRGRQDLLLLFEIAFELGSTEALKNYCELMSRLPVYRIYNDTVPKLWAAKRSQHAFILHRHLVASGDHPTDFTQIELFIRELARHSMKLEPFLRHLENSGVWYSHQARHIYNLEKIDEAQRVGKVTGVTLRSGPGSRPVKLSDAFVARTFATRSVSFDFVLNSLRFVGLFEVGPLAVRELALSANSISEMQRRFRQLETMEIDIGGSTYVQIVKSLCMAGESELLRSVVDSDMHYEVFQDVQKQKRLLVEYRQQQNMVGVHRTLAILTKGEQTTDAELLAARLMLQTCLVRGRWREALESLDVSRCQNNILPQRSELAPMRLALRRIWSDVVGGYKPDQTFLSRQPYLVGFMQFAQTAGLQVYPWHWRSVLYATARSGNWNVFRQQVISVARMIHGGSRMTVGKRNGDSSVQGFSVQDLMDKSLQSLIIEVGLTASIKGETGRVLWHRGINLLQTLRDRFKVKIDRESIADALKARLEELFRGVDSDLQLQVKGFLIQELHRAWETATIPTRENSLSQPKTQEDFQVFDNPILRLFQLRSRLIFLRRYPVEAQDLFRLPRYKRTNIDLDISAFEVDKRRIKDQTIDSRRQSSENQGNSVVYYEDLVHPSYGKPPSVHK